MIPILAVTFLELWMGRIAFPPSSGVASIYWEDTYDARGKRYKPWQISCAHRTEYFGSKLVVTNLANGKSVICPVQDRGPYKNGRVIDLSVGAADAIDCSLREGLCNVMVHRLGYE